MTTLNWIELSCVCVCVCTSKSRAGCLYIRSRSFAVHQHRMVPFLFTITFIFSCAPDWFASPPTAASQVGSGIPAGFCRFKWGEQVGGPDEAFDYLFHLQNREGSQGYPPGWNTSSWMKYTGITKLGAITVEIVIQGSPGFIMSAFVCFLLVREGRSRLSRSFINHQSPPSH